MFRRILFSVLAGVVVTLGTAAAAYAANRFGEKTISNILFWPNTLLQTFVPLHNIGTVERPVYEGTPLNFFAFLASFPFSILIYGLGAYFMLPYRKQRT
jgi:hypothetical protein